jgi:hypothetical protein
MLTAFVKKFGFSKEQLQGAKNVLWPGAHQRQAETTPAPLQALIADKSL